MFSKNLRAVLHLDRGLLLGLHAAGAGMPDPATLQASIVDTLTRALGPLPPFDPAQGALDLDADYNGARDPRTLHGGWARSFVAVTSMAAPSNAGLEACVRVVDVSGGELFALTTVAQLCLLGFVSDNTARLAQLTQLAKVATGGK